MERATIAAYWDCYDAQSGELLEQARMVKGQSWPAIGEMVVGVPGKPNAIVKDVKLKGMRGKLPYYDVYL